MSERGPIFSWACDRAETQHACIGWIAERIQNYGESSAVDLANAYRKHGFDPDFLLAEAKKELGIE